MDADRDLEGPLILETNLAGLGKRRQGKVRDIYDLGDTVLLVATDRISAFDVVLPDAIPGKGYVLTQLSKYWFEWLSRQGIGVCHHLLTAEVTQFPESCRPYQKILSGRSLLARKTEPFPVECIVRGYLSGSAWKEYRETGTVCDQKLPAGLLESDRLPEPIFTPSTKASEGHDTNISFRETVRLIGEEAASEVRRASLEIYPHAAALAEERGILIADTKFEFGRDSKTGRLLLIDEVLTPDSSRFWPKAGFAPGKGQPSFDKQFVRDYLDSISWDRRPPAPRLPQDVIHKTSQKYREALSRLTGSGAGFSPRR